MFRSKAIQHVMSTITGGVHFAKIISKGRNLLF